MTTLHEEWKTYLDKSEEDVIRAVLLGPEKKVDGGKILSTFARAKEELEGISNCENAKHGWEVDERHDDDGVAIHGTGCPPFVVVLGYMILLELIGKCFRPKSWPDGQCPCHTGGGPDFCAAVKVFQPSHWELDKSQIEALYAARCAFAHELALTNVNSDRKKRQHTFRLRYGSGGNTVVDLPKQRWDGCHFSDTNDCTTLLHLDQFVRFAEAIIRHVSELAEADGLRCILPGGKKELVHRHIIWFANTA